MIKTGFFLLIWLGCSPFFCLSSVAQNADLQKKIITVNRKLHTDSPYKGRIEVTDRGTLIHYQEVNKGTRKIDLTLVEEVKYVYDKYDPYNAPYSVGLSCKSDSCAQVEWADGMEMDYNGLLFSFTTQEEAEKMVQIFKDIWKKSRKK